MKYSATEWSIWLQWKMGLSKDCGKKHTVLQSKELAEKTKEKFKEHWRRISKVQRQLEAGYADPFTVFETLSLQKKNEQDRTPNETHITARETQELIRVRGWKKVTLIWQLLWSIAKQ